MDERSHVRTTVRALRHLESRNNAPKVRTRKTLPTRVEIDSEGRAWKVTTLKNRKAPKVGRFGRAYGRVHRTKSDHHRSRVDTSAKVRIVGAPLETASKALVPDDVSPVLDPFGKLRRSE